MRRTATIAVLALVTTAGEVSATPSPGARYAGTSGTGQRILLDVSDDGTRLAGYRFLVRIRCSDGKRRTQGLTSVPERPVAIGPDGRFANTGRPSRLAHRARGGGRVTGIARLRFAGRFERGGDIVNGRIHASFSSSRLRCRSGRVPFTASVAGTRDAPFRDENVATGVYREQQPAFDVTLAPFLPAREVERIEIGFTASCRSGGTLSGQEQFEFVPLQEPARFAFVARRARRGPNALRTRERHRMSGRFFFDGGYRVTGTWTLVATTFRHGRRKDVCSTRRSFSAVLDETR